MKKTFILLPVTIFGIIVACQVGGNQQGCWGPSSPDAAVVIDSSSRDQSIELDEGTLLDVAPDQVIDINDLLVPDKARDFLFPDQEIIPDQGIKDSLVPDIMQAIDIQVPDIKVIQDQEISIQPKFFPSNNPWNIKVDQAPVRSDSSLIISNMAPNAGLHRDFGLSDSGIPINYINNDTPSVLKTITYGGPEYYPDESDGIGPISVPNIVEIEAGSDEHLLIVNLVDNTLHEFWRAKVTITNIECGTYAKFDLTSNTLRPVGWTSADAAGLPITPGLIRKEELDIGYINHAIRFTMVNTRRAITLPATHYASSKTNQYLPPMGLRVRLKQSVNILGFDPQTQIILKAMKEYGMILADNGGNWFFQGEQRSDWGFIINGNDKVWEELKYNIHGSDFEVIDAYPIFTSYQAEQNWLNTNQYP